MFIPGASVLQKSDNCNDMAEWVDAAVVLWINVTMSYVGTKTKQDL